MTIENNDITRTSPNTPDPFGVGVDVDTGLTATLTCNTFDGWVTNLDGATQAPCITTTTLPEGTVGTPYSATLEGHTPNPPLTWTATGLPPRLTVAPDGTISGTPITPGTFTITATATDSTGAPTTQEFTLTINTTDITTACPGDVDGTTFTMTGDCDTTVPLTVPDGFTVDGAGFTITAHDTSPTVLFEGAVVTNGGTSMNVSNVTVQGTGFAGCSGILTGIFFVNASGSVSDVVVDGITANNGCQRGRGIVANALAGPAQTVTITGTTVSGYQKSGLFASGNMTMNVSESTIGPPDELTDVIAQNGVTYVGVAGGSLTDSTIHGSGFTGSPATSGTAVLLFTAADVTISGNTIVGEGTDTGIFVTGDSTGVVIENNDITRTSPNTPDNFGVGVFVDTGSTATLTCNTFDGWVTNLDGATQAPCITTTTLPEGTVGTPYSTTLEGHTPNPPLTWTATGLPPRLTVAPDGTISGTPITPGTFTITATATDNLGTPTTQDFTITIAPLTPTATVPGLRATSLQRPVTGRSP